MLQFVDVTVYERVFVTRVVKRLLKTTLMVLKQVNGIYLRDESQRYHYQEVAIHHTNDCVGITLALR